MATGFIERLKGKAILSKDCQQQMGTGGAIFKGGGNVYVNATTAGLGNTSDTNEDTLDTYSLPGNSLYGLNYLLTVCAFGQFAAAASTAKVAKLYFGSETVSITQGSLAAAAPFMLQLQVFKTASNVQFVTGQSITGTVHGGVVGQTTTAAETDTAAITIKVTGKTNTAAANDVVLYGWFVEAANF